VVVDELQKLDSDIHAEICGSFRRGTYCTVTYGSLLYYVILVVLAVSLLLYT